MSSNWNQKVRILGWSFFGSKVLLIFLLILGYNIQGAEDRQLSDLDKSLVNSPVGSELLLGTINLVLFGLFYPSPMYGNKVYNYGLTPPSPEAASVLNQWPLKSFC